MKILKIVLKELIYRHPNIVAIIAGVAIIIIINTITRSTENVIVSQLVNLGANILILPKDTAAADYYTADFQDKYMPDSFIEPLRTSGIHGTPESIQAKLTSMIRYKDVPIVLTGVLPQEEILSRPIWRKGTLFQKQIVPSLTPITRLYALWSNKTDPKLQRKRLIKLDRTQAIVGSEIADQLKLSKGDVIELNNYKLNISDVLNPNGSVDDGRIFCHLSTAQKILNKPGQISGIELIHFCPAFSAPEIVTAIQRLLPDTKVVTIEQILRTQVTTIKVMKQLSIILLITIIFFSGVFISNYITTNVNERRKEIGILLAMGTTPGQICFMFILKAIILTLTGGIIGYITGNILAIGLSLIITGEIAKPVISYLGLTILLAVVISIISSWLPAKQTAKIDVTKILREG